MARRALTFAFLALVVLPAAALAQQGVITGTVMDVRRQPLPGATVVALPAGSNEAPRRAVTDRSGRYRLDTLDPSRRYTIAVTLPGFSPVSRPDVDVSSGAAAIDVTLTVSSLAETLLLQLPPRLDLPGPRLRQAIPGRPCLHDTNETAAEAERRTEALAAMRLIAHIVASAAGSARHGAPFPSWAALASSPAIAALRNGSGMAAELAGKIDWGSSEPLPGWGITYMATMTDVRFAMTDLGDPCNFTYSSTDPQVVPPGFARVVPLT